MLVTVTGQPGTNGPSASAIPQSAVPLLAALIMAPPSGVHRGRVGDMLWPDIAPDKQNRRLNTATWRLRDAAGDEEHDIVAISGCGVMSLGDSVETDIGDLVALAHRSPAELSSAESGDLRAASAVPIDEVFSGCFHDLVVRSRERLRMTQLRALVALMKRERASGRADNAIWWGRRILELDPYREDVHRDLIALLRQGGRPRDALTQFEQCCSILRDDLGVEPLPETLRAAGIEHPSPPRAVPAPTLHVLISQAEQSCRDAATGLHEVLRELREPSSGAR